MKPSELNIVTPGTFGVFSTRKASSPYLYSGSFGNCVGVAIRGANFAVLAHFFAGSHVSMGQSLGNIAETLVKHFNLAENPLLGASSLVFFGGAPNGTSGLMAETAVKACSVFGDAKMAKKQYQEVLFNAVTGVVEGVDLPVLAELKKRDLFVAAASGGSGVSSDAVEWNYRMNYKSEPEGMIVMPQTGWAPSLQENLAVVLVKPKVNPYL